MDRPTYSCGSIQSVQSLCRALNTPEPLLRSIVHRAPNLYIGPKPKVKKSGGIRYVFDTKAPLKQLLKKINVVIFRRTYFPPYLTGSLAGRDFVANVDIHKSSRGVITEDIAKFFDCISEACVYRIWRDFFKFSDEIADILTHLTTKDGHVFQGTPTSSYLANLAFWDYEPALVDRLMAHGIRYSRYVDDITVSSVDGLNDSDKRWAIAQIYAMIGQGGFKPQRAKHQTFNAQSPITIMGLNANSGMPTLTRQERGRIRAQVFQLEQRLAKKDIWGDFRNAWEKASGKVGRLNRLHKNEGAALRSRLDAIGLALDALPLVTTASTNAAPKSETTDGPAF